MPVGVDSLDVKKQVDIPNGASPTGEYAEIPTDEENVDSDNDQSKSTKNKGLSVPKNDDDGGVTDSEDVHVSGDEDEFFQEKVKNRPTLQDLGILEENPSTQTINLTEGYTYKEGNPSASEEENDEQVHSRHKKNIKTMQKCQEMLGVQNEEDEGTTDLEDMEGSGDEIAYKFKGDDTLPAHYMAKDDGTIESKEKMTQVMPVPKAIPRVMVKHTPASSDDDEEQPKQHRRRTRGKQLAVASGDESGHTDVEDLHMGGAPEIKVTGGGEPQGNTKAVSTSRIKKRKHKKSDKKKSSNSSSLVTPSGDEEGVTDVEDLSGSCTESDSDLDSDIYGLVPPDQHADGMTDTEDVDASDDEGLVAPPVKKEEPFIIPEVHQTIEHIKDIQDKPKEEKGKDTDDEDFELDDKEDNKPLPARKATEVREVKKILLEPDDECDDALTDMEDMDMDEKAENELLEDYISRVPKETAILPCLKELEESVGNIIKSEKIVDISKLENRDQDDALTLQEALAEALTDVEDLDDDFEKPKVQQKKKKNKKPRKNDGTDEESMNESDFEEEPHSAPSKKKKGRERRLPLVSQLSEVRFVETKTGPLSIIVTPDIREKNPDKVIQDQVSGVLFLKEEEGAFTDFEELSGDEDKSTKSKKSKKGMKVPQDDQDALTDTENFEGEIEDLERPSTPLPTEREYSVLQSPKRELIRIKEDQHGVPQVSIEKLPDHMLAVSDNEDMGLTDTEDMDVTQTEAEQYMGMDIKRAEFDVQFPDCGTTAEYKTKVLKKKQAKSGLHVESDHDGHTDVEEIAVPKKGRKKNKSRGKFLAAGGDTDGHTDVENLSDIDGIKIDISCVSDNEHTDLDELEASETDDIHPSREDCATPDVIRRAAIKKVMVIKEGPHGITKTEHSEIAPNCGLGVPEDEIQGITDTSDMEASGDEEEEIQRPEVDLPEYSSDITIAEKSSDAEKGESKNKGNLLPPEDNTDAHTDVEDIGEGEGNRDP